MKKRRSGSFLTRCVTLTVLLALLSVLLASTACYYSMLKEEQRQEDASMHIAAATARQRMDDFLARYQLLLDHIMINRSYSRLYADGSSSSYEQALAERSFGNELEPYLSKLKGGDLFQVYLSDVTTTIHLSLNSAVIPADGELLSRLKEFYQDFASETRAPMCLQEYAYGGRTRAAVCAMRSNGEETLYFALSLNDDFWTSLADEGFEVYLSDSDGETFSQRAELPKGDSRCSETLTQAEWVLTAVYDYHSSLQLLPSPLGFALLAAWLGLNGALAFLLMRRRISEINAISSAMEARLLGKTILIRNPEKARKMRLSLTLALLLCLTAVFSVAGTAAFSYGSSAPANRKQIHQYYQRAVRQVAAYLDGLLSSYRQALENIAVNENVQYLFHAPANAANSAALWKLQQESGFVPPEYGNLTLYGLDGTLLASTIYNAEYLRTKPSYHTFTWDNMLHQRQLWQYRQGEWGSIRLGILVAGASRELPGHGEKLGTIWMDFDDTGLKSIMNDLITETSRCALYDRDGKLLLWTDGFEAPDTLNDLPDSSLYFCIEDETLPTNGWAVRLFVSNGAFSSQMKRVWLLTGALLLSILLVLIFVCIAIERDLLYAIYALARAMHAVQYDRSSRYADDERHPDEIRSLGRQFNRMMNQLDEATNRSVAIERKSREFEINMLQAQINPHFLYNTLRTVQVLIFRQDPRAITVIDQLITFFRSVSNVQVKVVTLRQEIAQVEAYVAIQTIRFGERFHVKYDLPEELMEAQVLHFCLQPLVENAISHGMSTIETGGVIEIGASTEENELILCVQDNGCGMSAEEIEKLRRRLDNAEYDSHIGILNVHQRIRLNFGSHYGIEVEPNPSAGLRVQMRFPYRTQMEETSLTNMKEE